MKINQITHTVVATVLIVALWCVTPPSEITAIALLGKIILTLATIHFCFFSHSGGIRQLFVRIKNGLLHPLKSFRQGLRGVIVNCTSYLCEVNLKDVKAKSNRLQRNPKNPEAVLPAIRHITNSLDLAHLATALTLVCIDFAVAQEALTLTPVIALIIITNLNIYIYAVIAQSIIPDTRDDSYGYKFGIATSCLFQWPLLFAVASAILERIHNGASAQNNFFSQPFFTVNLDPIRFGLSPAQAIIIISIILSLISCNYFCTTIHNFVYPPNPNTES